MSVIGEVSAALAKHVLPRVLVLRSSARTWGPPAQANERNVRREGDRVKSNSANVISSPVASDAAVCGGHALLETREERASLRMMVGWAPPLVPYRLTRGCSRVPKAAVPR